MTDVGRLELGPYEVGHASRARLGEIECGDAVWASVANDEIRVAVVDGLGHGRLAAEASSCVVKVVSIAPWGDLARLMTDCDRALRSTRGAAVVLLRILRGGNAEHCGVGNIALNFRDRSSKGAYSRPGIVGARPRTLAVDHFLVGPGETFAIHTDGLSHNLRPDETEGETIELFASRLIALWGKGHDDATCVVVRRRVED
jgi:hypothetical protein